MASAADNIFTIAADGDIDKMRQMIEEDTDVNKPSLKNETLLVIASFYGHKNIVKLLLEKGAEVDKLSQGKFTALFAASQKGHPEIVKVLLKNGANVNLLNNGLTALYIASGNGYTDIVKALLENEADVNILNNGNSALHIASQQGYLDIVKILLEYGAEVDKLSSTKKTALFLASLKGQRDVVKLLLENGAEVDKINQDKGVALYIASQEGHAGIVKILLDNGADVNRLNGGAAALHIASQEGHLDVVKILLNKDGILVDLLDDYNNTALYIATDGGFNEIVTELLKKGAEIDKLIRDKYTALWLASNNGNASMVKLLLDNGANMFQVIIDKTIYDLVMSSKKADIKAIFSAHKPYIRQTKGNIEKFSIFLAIPDYPPNPTNEQKRLAEENAKKNADQFALCPICMDFVERSMGCLYMHHVCNPFRRHPELYDIYKTDDGNIWWCTDCGRICEGHKHYKLASYPGEKPGLIITSSNPFTKTCLEHGGGSVQEKLARISRLVEVYAELQSSNIEIREFDARKILIEQMWNGPFVHLFINPQKVKRWKTNLSVFPNSVAASRRPAANIYRGAPSGSYKTPIIHENKLCLTDIQGSNVANKNVVQFIHKNQAGVLFDHIYPADAEHSTRFVCRAELLQILKNLGEKMGRCFDEDCKGYLYPEEVEKAFELIAIKDGLPLSIDEVNALAAYRERFPVILEGGGKGKSMIGGVLPSLNSFIHPMIDGKCYMSKKYRTASRSTLKSKSSKRKSTRRRKRTQL